MANKRALRIPLECILVIETNLADCPINAGSQVCESERLTAILAAKRSAGVTSEVNLRILLHTGNQACK